MTLTRDDAAVQVFSSLVLSQGLDGADHFDTLAEAAWKGADALLEARERKPADDSDERAALGSRLKVALGAIGSAMPLGLLRRTVKRVTGTVDIQTPADLGGLFTRDLRDLVDVVEDWPAYRARWIRQGLGLDSDDKALAEFGGAVQRELGGLEEIKVEDMAAIETAFAKDLAAVGA